MSVRSEYGFNKKEHDHALFYNKRHFKIRFEGYGTPDNSPDVDLYLKIDGKYRGLYVPEGIYAMVQWTACHLYGTTFTTQSELGAITRASGGNVTVVGGAIGTMNPTITPTANTTVQAVELVVSDADSEQVTYCVVEAEVWVIDTNATGQSQLPAAATATLTAAE